MLLQWHPSHTLIRVIVWALDNAHLCWGFHLTMWDKRQRPSSRHHACKTEARSWSLDSTHSTSALHFWAPHPYGPAPSQNPGILESSGSHLSWTTIPQAHLVKGFRRLHKFFVQIWFKFFGHTFIFHLLRHLVILFCIVIPTLILMSFINEDIFQWYFPHSIYSMSSLYCLCKLPKRVFSRGMEDCGYP